MYSLLILAAYPADSASTRYRILQFLPLLSSYYIKSDTHYFLSDKQYRVFYNSGNYVQKICVIIIALFKVCLVLFRVRNYNAAFVSRESLSFGPPILEFIVARMYKIPIIYDLDDALWVRYKSPVVGNLTSFIKPTSKVSQIAKIATHVIVCNDYLADYVKKYNPRTILIPTTVDTDKFSHIKNRQKIGFQNTKLTIGWIGSHSTTYYLRSIFDVIYELGKSYNFIFKIIGASEHISIPGVEVHNIKWDINTEIDEICTFNIGVYPVISDSWSQGKCAFKALQYQAAGAACVASPVGMIPSVITHGVNGLLAVNKSDWYSNIRSLLKDPNLRENIVNAGYANVNNKYTYKKYGPLLAKIIVESAQGR